MQAQAKCEFTFCYSEQNPKTLVMLYPPQKVLQKLVQPPPQRSIIWITQIVSEQLKLQIQQIQSKTVASVHFLSTINQAIDFLYENQGLNKVIVICSPQLSQQIGSKLNRRKQISLVIEYPTIEQQNEEELQIDQWDQQNKQFGIIKETQQSQVLNTIQQICSVQTNYKDFTNFVALKSEVWKSNILVRAMLAMINQQIDLPTRRQILDHFLALLAKMKQSHLLGNFVEELKKGPLSQQEAIRWYTRSEGAYKITNNLLRSSYHPSQIFYLQPFFKDLFKQIQSLHRKEQGKSFVCYRGGYLCIEEAEDLKNNLGTIVQSLSFLSTSSSKSAAISFVKNAFFEIIVDGQQKSEIEQGYASVKSFSEYFSEEEIIFNPLCSFRILEIQEYQRNQDDLIKYYVKLEYGSLAKIIKIGEKTNQINLTENDKCLISLGKIWKSFQSQIKDQGMAIMDTKYTLVDGSNYWQKYLSISKLYQHRHKGYINWAVIEQLKGAKKQSCKIMTKALQEFEQTYGRFDTLEMCERVKNLSPSQLRMIRQYAGIKVRFVNIIQNIEEAQQQCNKSIIPLMKLYSEDDQNYFILLFILAQVAFQKGEYQKSKQLHERINQFYLKIYGEYHPKYINSLNLISNILKQIGEYEKAKKLNQTCSKILLIMVGQMHSDYIFSLCREASILLYLGEYEKTERLTQKCFKLALDNLGEAHQLFKYAFKNYIEILFYLGRSVKLQQLLENNARILETVSSEGNFQQSANEFLTNLFSQGKQEESLLKMRQSCQIAKKVYGEKHQLYFSKLNNTASVLLSLKKYEESEQLYEKCCQLRLKYFGQRNFRYINYLCNLAILYTATKRHQKAFQLFEKCSILSLDLYGDKHPIYGKYLLHAATTLFELGQKQKGETYLQKCYAMSFQNIQASNIDKFTTLSSLAQILTNHKKYSLAYQAYSKSCHLLPNIFHKTHSRHIKFVSSLAYFNFQIGHYREAIRMKRYCCCLWESGKGTSNRGKNEGNGELIRQLGGQAYFLVCLGDYWKALVLQGKLLKLAKSKEQQFKILKSAVYILDQLRQYKKALKMLKLLHKTQCQFLPTSFPLPFPFPIPSITKFSPSTTNIDPSAFNFNQPTAEPTSTPTSALSPFLFTSTSTFTFTSSTKIKLTQAEKLERKFDKKFRKFNKCRRFGGKMGYVDFYGF